MAEEAKVGRSVAGAIALLAAVACADPTMPSRALLPAELSRQVLSPEIIDYLQTGWPEGLFDGNVRLCKTTEAGAPGGTFTFTVFKVGTGVVAQPLITVPEGGGTVCEIVYTSLVLNRDTPEQLLITENTVPNWTIQDIDIRRLLTLVIFSQGGYIAPRLDDAVTIADRLATVFINSDMTRIVRFRNTFQAPPPDVCDFITFGRLVIEVGGEKVVISGNAGGFNADQSIKNEFHIDANGVDNHVADAFSYGPITSGPLSDPVLFPNSRIVTGTAKNGVEVELRVWDGGEPGKDTDLVYVKLNGSELLGPGGQFIDLGNMQYHSNCRDTG